ncbi:MAG: hypothetical protein HQK72_17980 [Desulfamplus sp.]|nr:hypothetical protein [Desulfamplus sp.]
MAIESDLENCSRFVEFCHNNYSTYSLEFARIIMASGSELDTVIRLLCKSISPKKEPNNILEYYPILNLKYPNFASFEIYIPRYKILLHPWKDWSDIQAPYWWSKAYNKIKHERDKFFKEANLINTLNAVAGLLCIILYYYKECFKGEDGIDNRYAPKLFVPSYQGGYSWSGPWHYYTPD